MLLATMQLAKAQNQERQQPLGSWYMYFGDNKINDKWGVHSELQLRNYFLPNTIQQTLTRVGANYYLSKATMLTAGYGFIHTTPSNEELGGFTTLEHRIWQQAILRHRTYNVFLEHRYRLEQRFIENQTLESNTFDNRIRYRFMALFPLYNFSPQLRHYFLAAYNELFMNLGETVSGQIFDRNRLYFAVGYQFNTKFNIQVGYLNQVISLPGTFTPDINHNFQASISFNMDELGSMFMSSYSSK